MKLQLITRLHELSQHFNFLFTYSILQIHLSLDLCGTVHASRGINAEDQGRVILCDLVIVGTLEHINHIIS